MTPEELQRLEQEAAERVECGKCGWVHHPSKPCAHGKPNPEKLLAMAYGEVDPYAKFIALAEEAKKHPTQETRTGRACGFCHKPVIQYKNFWNVVWEEIDGELVSDHAKKHAALMTVEKKETPDLAPVRRSGRPGDSHD